MGYRSCVASVIYTWEENEWPLLKLFVEENFPKGQLAECLTPFENNGRRGPNRTTFRGYKFMCDDVKWYESYPDVACHDALIEFAGEWVNDEDNKSEIAFVFVRIGEETDDVEERCGGDYDYDWVQVHRSIERDW